MLILHSQISGLEYPVIGSKGNGRPTLIKILLYISFSGRSLARLKCWSGGPEIGGSNPLAPTNKSKTAVVRQWSFFMLRSVVSLLSKAKKYRK